MAMVKMLRTQIRFGVPTQWEVRDAQGQLLLSRGGVIENDEQLAALLAHGPMIDSEDVRAALLAERAQAPAAPPTEVRSGSLFDLWERLIWRLERVLKGMGESPGFPDRIEELAEHLEQLVQRDADIGIFLAVRQDQNRFSIYGLTHSIFTALICSLMGHRLGWPAARRRTLVKAALTMNVAMVELQGRLAAQSVSLLPEQKALIREHPVEGARMLREAGVSDEEWLTAIEQHHEWTDGSGYPKGLTQVSEVALALKYADVFMAKISPRIIRQALSVQEAARQLFKLDGGGPMSMAIIKEFGIYPPGEYVKLKSGELAVVVRRTGSANTPIAASVTDKSGVPVASVVCRETAKAEFAITGLVADKTLVKRVPPERLYGLEPR